MTKYTVVDYYIKGGQLHTDQVSKWFDSIQDAEAARVVILNERHPNVTAQSLRVVQYDFK